MPLMENDYCPQCRLLGRAGFLRFSWRPREYHEQPIRLLTCTTCGCRDDTFRHQLRPETKLLTDQRAVQ